MAFLTTYELQLGLEHVSVMKTKSQNVSKEPGELLSRSVAILLDMGEKTYRAARERSEYIFDQWEQLKAQAMDRSEEANFAADDFLDDDDDVEMDNDDNVTSEGMKRLEKLYKRFEAYCKELFVFGFNSAGYDIKLIKKFLFKDMRTWSTTNLHCQEIRKVSLYKD